MVLVLFYRMADGRDRIGRSRMRGKLVFALRADRDFADREVAKPGRREGRGAAAADVEERATAREGAPERAPEEDRAQRGEARHWVG